MHDPNDGSRLVGLDWQGNPVATVKPPDTKLQQAPDGSLFQVEPGAGVAWWTGKFLDRLGQPLRTAALPSDVLGGRDIWADDSKHVCLAANDPADNSWRLIVAGPGFAARIVGVVAIDSDVADTFDVAACSLSRDRAVVVRTASIRTSNQFVGWTSDVWVVRLSDGAALAHHAYVANRVASIVASSDATYVAENSQFDPSPDGGSATSQIRRVSDWASVKPLTAAVQAFSGDDSLVLVVPASLADKAGFRQAMAVVDWRSGATRWQQTIAGYYQAVAARPGGQDFALGYGSMIAIECPVASWVCSSPVEITIVRGDGSAFSLPDRYIPVW